MGCLHEGLWGYGCKQGAVLLLARVCTSRMDTNGLMRRESFASFAATRIRVPL